MSNQQTRLGIPTSAEPHPLEAAVLKIFAEHEARGVSTLRLTDIAVGLAGTGLGSERRNKAYLTVAEDVLNYLFHQDKLQACSEKNTERAIDAVYWIPPRLPQQPADDVLEVL
jgi:hypothetical protein